MARSLELIEEPENNITELDDQPGPSGIQEVDASVTAKQGTATYAVSLFYVVNLFEII